MRRSTLALLIGLLVASPAPASDHADEIDAWHEGRIERLRQPNGWLSLVGLISLPEGRSSFGTGDGVDLRLDAPGPAHIGDVVVEGTKVRFTAVAIVTHDDASVGEIEMAADVTGEPTILQTGSLSFYLILRHDRPYFRVRDAEAPLLAEFDGIQRWPVDEAWRVRARWVEYDQPQTRHFPDVLGVAEPAEVTGEARFTIGDAECALFPNSVGDSSMFFVFGDATNGLESYGGGRFLYTDLPSEDGTFWIDFNRSYNPPCVFTPYATCPLPADGNFLDVEITAGEKMFGEAH